MTRRQFLARGATALALAGCDKEPLARLRIGTSICPALEPLFLARHLRVLDEKAIQIAEYPTVSELVLSFQNRALDAIMVTVADAARLASFRHDLRIVAVLTYSNGADAIVGVPSLTDVASLRGKTVVFETDTLGAYFLARALDKAGLAATDVNLRASRADRANRFITMKEADAVVTYEPYRTSLLRLGTKVIFDSSQLPGEIVHVLAVRSDVILRRIADLKRLMQAWHQGAEYLAANSRAAAEVLAIRERLTPDQFVASLDLLRFVKLEESRQLLSPGANDFSRMLQSTADFMLKHDLLPAPVDASSLRDDHVVRPG
jgi:NitT/TauT family transport system substrate-binding protein